MLQRTDALDSRLGSPRVFPLLFKTMITEERPKVASTTEEPSQDSIMYVPVMIGKLSAGLQALSERQRDGFKRNDDAQEATNEHLKTLNGKVAEHARQLADQERFRESVTGEARIKAEKAATIKARRVGAIWAIGVSLATFIVIGLVAYIIFHYFHIDLRSVK